MDNTNVKKNKDFFHLQYDHILWKNQEKTKINTCIYDLIIKKIIESKKSEEVAIFDIGFGIGLFIKMLVKKITKHFKKIIIEGCEPSKVGFEYFSKNVLNKFKGKAIIEVFQERFLDVENETKFDFMTATYVFPHFLVDDLRRVVEKIYSMLNEKGQFILVVANEKYLKNKLDTEKDLFIENGKIKFNNKEYNEILHYSEIPKIGKVIDYNREEKFYIDLFLNGGFMMKSKEDYDDNGFVYIICF